MKFLYQDPETAKHFKSGLKGMSSWSERTSSGRSVKSLCFERERAYFAHCSSRS